jgi:hypothetical protein
MATTKRVWFGDLMCCGDPFAVGSTVTWLLYPVEDDDRRFFVAVFGEVDGGRVTDVEERHDFGGWAAAPALTPVTGVVRSIEAASWAFRPQPVDEQDPYPPPDSVVVEARSSASRHDEVGGQWCCGYLVDLEVADPG